jgi:hypothetical protein
MKNLIQLENSLLKLTKEIDMKREKILYLPFGDCKRMKMLGALDRMCIQRFDLQKEIETIREFEIINNRIATEQELIAIHNGHIDSIDTRMQYY